MTVFTWRFQRSHLKLVHTVYSCARTNLRMWQIGRVLQNLAPIHVTVSEKTYLMDGRPRMADHVRTMEAFCYFINCPQQSLNRGLRYKAELLSWRGLSSFVKIPFLKKRVLGVLKFKDIKNDPNFSLWPIGKWKIDNILEMANCRAKGGGIFCFGGSCNMYLWHGLPLTFRF